jgi:hypothetical protein
MKVCSDFLQCLNKLKVAQTNFFKKNNWYHQRNLRKMIAGIEEEISIKQAICAY